MPEERIERSFLQYQIGSGIPVGGRSTLSLSRSAVNERSSVDQTIEFYENASEDYEHWSRDLNMHLGCYLPALGVFDREAMLVQMNLEVAGRLRLDRVTTPMLVDLGCGAGAISRTIARQHPNAIIKGVTVSPKQVQMAQKLNSENGLSDRIEIIECDYRTLPFDDGTADGVWAVESACYASGPGKEDLVREMARVLKPGRRFAVADCFLKKHASALRFPVDRCYSSVCKSWALEEMPVLDPFVRALRDHGFGDIVVEDISWRVAPSLAHAPGAVLSFIVKNIFAGKPLMPHSIGNLKASLLAPVLGFARSSFSYCLISGNLIV